MIKIPKVGTYCILASWLVLLALQATESAFALPRNDHKAVQSKAATISVTQGGFHRADLALGMAILDLQGLSNTVSLSLRSEIERLFKSTRVAIQMDVSESVVAELPPTESLNVRVRLWPRDGTVLNLDPSVMGAVRLNEGHAVESVHVFFPVVIDTMLRRGETSRDLTDFEIGRALGRVIAHELIHAVAPRAPHSGYGLMQHVMDREFLRSPRPTRIDRVSAMAFARRLTVRTQLADGR